MKRTRAKHNLQRVNDLPWTTEEFTSCLERALGVEGEILEKCRVAGFSEQDLFGLKLAVEEALVNACKHGNKMDPGKRVRVQYRITGQRADVVVEDEGNGFNPLDVPDPTVAQNLERCCGRGILLMRHYMNNVVFSPAGNKVTLTKFNETGGQGMGSKAALG